MRQRDKLLQVSLIREIELAMAEYVIVLISLQVALNPRQPVNAGYRSSTIASSKLNWGSSSLLK